MKNYKSRVLKYVLSGLAIFIFGIFIGYQLTNERITSIQGYLFNAAGEATDSNASDSNASDSNASDANATNANAVFTDNIIYLQYFALDSVNALPGEKVNVNIATSGACNSAASIVFKSTSGDTFTVQVEDITNNPYIIIPTSVVTTTYSVTELLLVGRNSDNSTFTKQYSESGDNIYYFNSPLTIIKDTNNNDNNIAPQTNSIVILNSISLVKTTAKVSEKVFLNLNTNEKLKSLKLEFTSTDNKKFNVYARDLANNPYIVIPSSTKGGTYTLTSATLFTSDSSTVYSKDGTNDTEKFDFNSTIEIKDNTETTFIYNNEDITSSILAQIFNAPVGTEITVNASSNTLINTELFNAIKGKDKTLTINYKDSQIVFNGNDITDSKTIDISMEVNNVSKNEDIKKLVSNGIVVNFPDNGNLPGEALIRVKVTDEVKDVLNDNVYVYVYNELSNNFCLVAANVKKTSDEYYEFTITHNSDYLIINKELDNSLVVDQSSNNVVSFQKDNKTYLMIIAIAVVIIIAVIVLMIVLKKKKKKNVPLEPQTLNSNDNL